MATPTPETPGCVWGSARGTSDFIAKENARAGDPGWVITQAADREIEGYASSTSVGQGQTLELFVSTPAPRFRLEIFRMGWYGGAGARRVASSEHPGGLQIAVERDPDSGLLEAQWSPSVHLQLPPADADDPWVSGMYLAKLTAIPDGYQRYIPFVVRDDARSSDLLFQSSVNTFAAYNAWGGLSLYGSPAAVKVSLHRPYRDSADYGFGAGQLMRWELNALRFLEREGYAVKYATDVDVHRDPCLLTHTRVYLSVGHDEYWSWQMRDHVERARDHGVSLMFLGANAAYWQIRYEPSLSGDPLSTIVAYKAGATNNDPVRLDPVTAHLTTARFRDPIVNRHEAALVGVAYEPGSWPVDVDYVVKNASHWVYSGTSLHDDSHLFGMVGYEADRAGAASPSNLEILSASPFVGQGHVPGESNASIYRAGGDAWVFAAGTMQWSWGLDDFVDDLGGRGPRESAEIQQITKNVLRRMLDRP
ncbi:MAG: DUF6605 domain-containing protein [Myxococcota bacterium]